MKKLYFAYSTILDAEAFQEWKAHHGYLDFQLPKGRLAAAIDQKIVFDFPSRFWGGRVAGLEKKDSHKVYGMLFEIPVESWNVIEHKEGVVTGMSVEVPVTVEVDGQKIEASAFTTSPDRVNDMGQVSMTFLDAWKRGALSAGLPNEFVDRIVAEAE